MAEKPSRAMRATVDFRYRLIEMTERGDFAIVAYGYAVPRAIPQISNPGELRGQYGRNSSILTAIANLLPALPVWDTRHDIR